MARAVPPFRLEFFTVDTVPEADARRAAATDGRARRGPGGGTGAGPHVRGSWHLGNWARGGIIVPNS